MARAAWEGRSSRALGRRSAGVGLLAASFCILAASAGQTSTQPGIPQGLPNASQGRTGIQPLNPADTPNPLAGSNASKLEHMREDERHKRLTADTAKLVELTNQLKEEVDKATKDELSVDVVRKAAEIEKLAHDVKERMKS